MVPSNPTKKHAHIKKVWKKCVGKQDFFVRPHSLGERVHFLQVLKCGLNCLHLVFLGAFECPQMHEKQDYVFMTPVGIVKGLKAKFKMGHHKLLNLNSFLMNKKELH